MVFIRKKINNRINNRNNGNKREKTMNRQGDTVPLLVGIDFIGRFFDR